MTEMPSYVIENPQFEPSKPKKKQYNSYSSLLTILLSIFAYILIFYVLEVSPSSIFNDTKILFFISNALIIIIAADYGAFADKENHDFYGEYTAATRSYVRENPRSEALGYEGSLTEEIKNREKQEESVEEEIPEKTVQVMSENQPRSIEVDRYEPTTEQNIHVSAVKEGTSSARKLVRPKPYGRSKSDKVRRSMRNTERRQQEIKHRSKSYDRSKSDSSKWMVVHKAEEAAEEKWENVREESEEFSKMSNEELNRRVEDFIKRQSFV